MKRTVDVNNHCVGVPFSREKRIISGMRIRSLGDAGSKLYQTKKASAIAGSKLNSKKKHSCIIYT